MGHFLHTLAPTLPGTSKGRERKARWCPSARWVFVLGRGGKWLPLPRRLMPEGSGSLTNVYLVAPSRFRFRNWGVSEPQIWTSWCPRGGGISPLKSTPCLAAVDAEISRRRGVNPPRAELAPPLRTLSPPPPPYTHIGQLREAFLTFDPVVPRSEDSGM